MDGAQLLKIVEQFIRKGDAVVGGFKVVRVPDFKTVYVEETDEGGQAIFMTKCKVDGKVYWAGFSLYSQTVYVSRG